MFAVIRFLVIGILREFDNDLVLNPSVILAGL